MQQPNAGNAPAMQGAPGAPTGADPAVMAAGQQPGADQLGPNEEAATPEEEALLQKAADTVTEFLHGEKRDQVAKDIAQGQGELYERVSDVAYPLLMGMSQSAKDADPGFDFWMALGTIAIEELFAIADAADLPGAQDQEQMEAALLDMVVRHGEENQDNPEAVEAAKQAATEMAQTGQIQETMNAFGGGQTQMAQGVKQGLAGGAQAPGAPGGMA